MNANQLISDIIRRDMGSYSDDTLLADIDGWDSLKNVRLILRLEEMIGRQLPEDDIERLHSIGDVGRLLTSGR